MPNSKTVQALILSIFSGILCVLIFPKWNLEFLAWTALVPLLFALKDQPPHRAAGYGFIFGMVFYLCGLSWITNTLTDYGHIAPWMSWGVLALLAAWLGTVCALFCYGLQWLSRGVPAFQFLLAPALWTALEYLRSTHEKYGFSWLGLGYSQFQTLPIIQIAEYAGVYGVTALIVAVNAGVYYLLNAWYFKRGDEDLYPKTSVRGVAVLTFGVLLACWGFGEYRLIKVKGATGGKSIKVALVQGNIDQAVKWNPLFKNKVIDVYRDLTLEAGKGAPDLIVWPEAATPYFFERDIQSRALLRAVRDSGTPLLFGSPRIEGTGKASLTYNSAYLVSPKGETLGRYDKSHLVPFGEFVPFREWLWFVEKMVAMVGEFGRGSENTVFEWDGPPFGVSICYEITFPDLVRKPVKNGAQFLVNITNDAWFGKSAASYQHMAMGVLRAVENRTPIVRAANTGISGVIDPTGRIRQTTPLFEKALVQAEILPNPNPGTFYSQNGDWFCWLCIALCAIVGFMARRQPVNRA